MNVRNHRLFAILVLMLGSWCPGFSQGKSGSTANPSTVDMETDGAAPHRVRTAAEELFQWLLASNPRALAQGQWIPISWTHALGYDPYGLCFIADMTYQGHDYYVMCDLVGTPFAFKNIHSGDVFYTPFNPWGELLATPDTMRPAFDDGLIPTIGFSLPPDPVFGLPPVGLFGHVYDPDTGMVAMHHRPFHPRIGHFLTRDFQTPDVFVPSTYLHPYALAAGDPMMAYDPDGLNDELTLNGKIRIEFERNGVKDFLFVDSLLWERVLKGEASFGNAWFEPLPKGVSARRLVETVNERREIIASVLVEQMYPEDQIDVTPRYLSNVDRDAMMVILTGLSLPFAAKSALILGLRGTLCVTASSAAWDVGHQTMVEDRSLGEVNLLRTAGASYIAICTGGSLKMGIGSSNAFVRGGTKFITGLAGGAGTVYGGVEAYEGYLEGDVGKGLFGTATSLLSAMGTYSIMKSLFTPPRAPRAPPVAQQGPIGGAQSGDRLAIQGRLQQKLDAWKKYNADPNNADWSKERWSRAYDNLQSSRIRGDNLEFIYRKLGMGSPGGRLPTPIGVRIPDAVDGLVLREIKSGNVYFSKFIRRQMYKDWYLKRTAGFQPEWHFHGGVSPRVLNKLETYGIPHFFH